MNQYSIEIHWSDEDEGYIASIPEFKTLESFGETPAEAIQNAQDSLELFIEVYAEKGLELPAPRKKKATVYSGQFRYRPGPERHGLIDEVVQRTGVSQNNLINQFVDQGLGRVEVNQNNQQVIEQVTQMFVMTTYMYQMMTFKEPSQYQASYGDSLQTVQPHLELI